MLPCGLIPLVMFLLFSALGGKDCIQVLTGIQPFSYYEMALGAGYLLAYAGVTLLSPIFLIAAGMIRLWDCWREKS